MIGDSVTDGDDEFVVVWSGGEGLIAERPTKPSGFWTPPKRLCSYPETRKPPTVFTSGDIDRMYALRDNGVSFADIGTAFGVYGSVISSVLRRLGKLDKSAETPENGVSPNKFTDSEGQ